MSQTSIHRYLLPICVSWSVDLDNKYYSCNKKEVDKKQKKKEKFFLPKKAIPRSVSYNLTDALKSNSLWITGYTIESNLVLAHLLFGLWKNVVGIALDKVTL